LLIVYECDTWSFTIIEEHRLMVFESRVLRMILGPEQEEGTGDWRKQHNEELHDLYTLPDIKVTLLKRMRLVGHVACVGEMC
jgi:hypothetical protein